MVQKEYHIELGPNRERERETTLKKMTLKTMRLKAQEQVQAAAIRRE